MKISPANDIATMINVFTVEPENQQQLIDIWLKEGKQFERLPGLISAALHRSTDGKRVINYAQFQKAEDWLDISRHADQLFGHFRAISQSDPHLYEVIYQSTASGALHVTIEQAASFATMINVFTVEPE
ncbi:MAG: antibiotic biosynthesis monooxygenase, partial [Ktedonobacteraceae bacterium]|nr:antibiotic biosynthesis monooxygenase [Ktedonobacteraceae bacterium]